MTTLNDLLRNARHNLDDDGPRLVLADMLEEAGDARAEHVRLQCELARWVPELERRTELQAREGELREANEDSWLGPLRNHFLVWEYERGLLHVTMLGRRFATKTFGKLIAKDPAWPWVQSLRLREARAHLPRLADGTNLDHVVALSLQRNQLDDASLEPLWACASLANVRRLDLDSNDLSDASVKALIACPHLANLEWLDLRNNRFTSRGVKRLLASPLASRLRWLDLHGNDLDAETQAAVHARQRPYLTGKGGAPARRIINSLGMHLALIPAGTFEMGGREDYSQDEGPLHEVTISRSFYLGMYPVTQAQYERLTLARPSHFRRTGYQQASWPVEMVSCEEAEEFCRLLSELPEEKAAGRVYRLPTEAEWEYACRAGTTTAFHWGNDASSTLHGNFNGNDPYGDGELGPSLGEPTPVGAYPPNAWGLYDMHGNVGDWTADWYAEDAYERHDPVDPCIKEEDEHHNSERVIRGGSWDDAANIIRSARRYCAPPDSSYYVVGIRVAMTVER
jgi:uncharacterized protein (TIGR02996 family)